MISGERLLLNSRTVPKFEELEKVFESLRMEHVEFIAFTFEEEGLWHWWLGLPTEVQRRLPLGVVSRHLFKSRFEWANPSLRKELIGPDDLVCTPIGISLLGDQGSYMREATEARAVEVCKAIGQRWSRGVIFYTFDGSSWEYAGRSKPYENNRWFDDRGQPQDANILRSQLQVLSREFGDLLVRLVVLEGEAG